MSNVLTSIDQLIEATPLRVEPLEIVGDDGETNIVYMRELNGATTSELAKRSPNIVKQTDGTEITMNETNRINMAFVVSNSWVHSDTELKLVAGGRDGEKKLSKVPARTLKTMFKFALEISDLNDSEEESEGKELDS